MSYIHPGIDTRHIIKDAMNAKTLAELSRIEDKASKKSLKYAKIEKAAEHSVFSNKFPFRNENAAKEMVKGKTSDEILNLSGIQKKLLKNGSFGITSYGQPSINYTYSDIGVKESDLIDGISVILGNCNLQNTSLKNTADIKAIKGDLSISASNSQLKDLSSIKEVQGSVFVHTDDKSKVIQTLKDLNFRPNKLCGKILQLPEKI